MTDRITADILVEAFDLAKSDFDDLKDRIEEAAAAHKATMTVDGRLYPASDAPAAVPSVPAGADLRDRIAEAVRTFDFANYGLDAVDVALHDYPEQQEWVPALTDAVLAVLPAPADRVAALTGTERTMLRHALDFADANMTSRPDEYTDADHTAMNRLRRMADEAQQAEPHLPAARYRRDDGVDCCVHATPVGPGSCAACRELDADEGQP